ncbi:MAG: DUF4402 domain-containing protein [Myxococcota bacterium]
MLGAACLLGSPAALAQTLEETVQLQFGTLVQPSAGSETWTIDLNDTGSGTATFVGGVTLTGEYLVRKGGGPGRPIFIDVAPNGSIPGLTMGSFTASYDGSVISLPASGQPNPANGKVLRIGATLTLDSSVASGQHLLGLTITIIKE